LDKDVEEVCHREAHRGGIILTFGILSALFGTLSVCCGIPALLGLAFGIPAWVMASHDLHKMRIGGMDRQTLRDWVHRFNAEGPDGLKDIRSKGHRRRLAPDQLTALAEIAETGPDRAKDGVVRWRRVDLKRVIEERFGVVYHERTIGKLLKQLGFSHISARPRHPGQKAGIIKAFKKTSRRP
jgi:transposase